MSVMEFLLYYLLVEDRKPVPKATVFFDFINHLYKIFYYMTLFALCWHLKLVNFQVLD